MSDPDMDRLADLLDLPHGSPDVAYAACERIARLSSAQDRNSREFYEAIGLDLDQSLPYAMAWAVVLLNRRDRRIADLESERHRMSDQSLPYAMAWAVVLLNRRDRRIADLERGRA